MNTRSLVPRLAWLVSATSACGQTPKPEGPAPDALPGAEVGIPGLETVDHRLKPAPLLREGTFLVDRRGSMVPLTTGEWVFIFHRDAQGSAEQPMLMLPCLRLGQMSGIAQANEGTVFLVSGQVMAYRDRNYLLPTMHRVAPGGSASGIPAPPDSPPAIESEDPSAEEIIRGLESRADARRLAARPMEAIAGADAGAVGGATEGAFLFRRRARMSRQAAGEWAIVFDSDAGGGGGGGGAVASDPPLIPLPCLVLEDLERTVSSAEEAVELEVSGRVLSYAGRGYVIPTLVRRLRARDIGPRQ